MASENNRMSGRVRRYTRVGTSVGGLAARMAGQRYLGMPGSSAKNAADLRRTLGGLKGPLMKVAQLLATIPDVLPDDYIEELRALQSQAPAMGWSFVKRRMRSELGIDWQSRFESFEQDAAAAASLGQVHRAHSLDGRLLACKLQYPDMSSTVEADLSQLKLVFALYKRHDPAIDTSEVQRELVARLREELDYVREARHLCLFAEALAEESSVYVPEVIPDLSTSRLLTMTWLDGTPLLDAKTASQDVRNRIARNLFNAWYRPLYHYGVLHGDPHLGNYTICPDGAVNLLDYGCIRILSASFIQGVIDLYRAVQRNDRELMMHAFERWGFTGLSSELADALSIWAKYIYGPLTDDRVRLIDESGSGRFGGNVAAMTHKEIRRLGVVKLPREFVLLDRSAIGLGSVFLHLEAKLNWHHAFELLIEGFDSDTLDRRQSEILARTGVPEAA